MARKVDQAGRVVIPKTIREKLGLQEGMEIEFKIREGELVLSPVDLSSPMVQEGNLLLHDGRATGNLERAVQKHRKERISEVSGGT